MAKKSVTGGRGITGIQFSGKTQERVPSATRSGGMPSQVVTKPMSTAEAARSYRYMTNPTQAGTFNPYGKGYKGPSPRSIGGVKTFGNFVHSPNAMVKPASAPAPIKTQVKPKDVVSKAVGAVKSKAADVVRTVTNMKNSPTPQRGTNLGVTTGKVTGTSATRGGTGGRTTGGGRAAGGGYTNAGPAGPGASGRGTGGKR
jgi:hypothetical protein